MGIIKQVVKQEQKQEDGMFRFDSVVRYSEIDADRYMTLPAVLDILQDCCTFHSEYLEMGIDYLKEHERAWVSSTSS